ncbi:MAG TPA: hypothetical protein VFS00_27015 [Polyangiaceae bacterium]|nr:hypothetical protein [Polyangiaceae bacterium]
MLTWAGTSAGAGVEVERRFGAPAAVMQPAPGPDGTCRKSVAGACADGRADGASRAATTPVLLRRAQGQVLGPESASTHLRAGEFEPALRSASSGWEWGAGSAAVAAWLLGLRQRLRRRKA